MICQKKFIPSLLFSLSILFIHKAVFVMDRIIERLKRLREEGQMIITPDFCISYNPYKDVFVVEVPEDMKFIELTHSGSRQTYYWTVSGMYPYEADASKTIEAAWTEIEPYTHGATIDMLPTFTQDGKEFVWFDEEDGDAEAVLKETITMVN